LPARRLRYRSRIGAWSFRYGLEQGRNRLTVFQAVNGSEL